MRKVRLIAIAAAMAIACVGAAGVSPSSADTPPTLSLALEGPAQVGKPLVIQASGTDPVVPLERLYFELDAIPSDVVSACPAGFENGAQVANATGGLDITFADPEDYDAAGNFSMPVGLTPSGTGTFLLCGYTDDGATDTLAVSQLTVTVTAAGSSGGSPPKPASKSPNATYKKTIAGCDKLKGKRKAACSTKAKLVRALALCAKVRGARAHARCTATARRRYRVG